MIRAPGLLRRAAAELIGAYALVTAAGGAIVVDSLTGQLGHLGNALVSGLVWAQARYNLQQPQTEVARQIYDLHTIILVICLVIFVGVFGMMFYSVVRHRKSVGHQAAQFHENATVEIIWTVVPFHFH